MNGPMGHNPLAINNGQLVSRKARNTGGNSFRDHMEFHRQLLATGHPRPGLIVTGLCSLGVVLYAVVLLYRTLPTGAYGTD